METIRVYGPERSGAVNSGYPLIVSSQADVTEHGSRRPLNKSKLFVN